MDEHGLCQKYNVAVVQSRWKFLLVVSEHSVIEARIYIDSLLQLEILFLYFRQTLNKNRDFTTITTN